MKSWHVFAYVAAGVLLALITPVNAIIASVMTPLLSAVTGGKGSYV